MISDPILSWKARFLRRYDQKCYKFRKQSIWTYPWQILKRIASLSLKKSETSFFWMKAIFLIQSWAGKHGSWGDMTKKLKISNEICLKFHPSNFYEDSLSELGKIMSRRLSIISLKIWDTYLDDIYFIPCRKLVFWSEMKLENIDSEGVGKKKSTFRKICEGTSFYQVLMRIAFLSSKESKKKRFLDWRLYFWSNHELENMVPEEVWQKNLKISKGICLKIHPSNFYEDCFSELEEIISCWDKIFLA